MLDREEYIEQAHFFRTLSQRLRGSTTTQDLLASIREEVLATTKLPMAIDFLASELRLKGIFSSAMEKLGHYFTPFQTFVVAEAEREKGKFDLFAALEILQREASYRGEGASPQGLFLFEFEAIARNRLGYDRGLEAIAGDPMFDAGWREWILMVRRQVGLSDIADLLYVRSEYYVKQKAAQGHADEEPKPVLFGEREGRIALANRRKDPLLLFSALHRQLGYPEVPRPTAIDETPKIVPSLVRRMERLEARLKLIEEEQKGGIDLRKFYGPNRGSWPTDDEPS